MEKCFSIGIHWGKVNTLDTRWPDSKARNLNIIFSLWSIIQNENKENEAGNWTKFKLGYSLLSLEKKSEICRDLKFSSSIIFYFFLFVKILLGGFKLPSEHMSQFFSTFTPSLFLKQFISLSVSIAFALRTAIFMDGIRIAILCFWKWPMCHSPTFTILIIF